MLRSRDNIGHKLLWHRRDYDQLRIPNLPTVPIHPSAEICVVVKQQNI